jgi:hypothetical protein
LAVLFLPVLAGIAYYGTLSPSVVQIDCGELAAVQALPGVAHPTGYPLFTILGYAFSKLPLFSSTIRRLNFLSLVWCVLGLWLFCKSLKILLDALPQRQISVLLGGAFLAFSRTYWSQSTSVEVYALHVFLLNLILYFSIRAFSNPGPAGKSWIWAAVALALGLSNHMTAILLVPGLLYLYFVKNSFNKSSTKNLLLLFFIASLLTGLIYLYLPLRARQNPILNWGNPCNWDGFFRHVTGRQYQVWMFSSAGAAFKNLTAFFGGLPAEFSWPGFALGGWGLAVSLARRTKLPIFLALTFILNVAYAVNYNIHDLDSYFLLSYLIFAVWIAFGVQWILHRIRFPRAGLVFSLLAAAAVFFEFRSNYPKVDQSDVVIYGQYARNALESLPENAVLLTYQWDVLVSPSYYFQTVENFRRDVAVVDKELLRRSWYYNQMETSNPRVMDGIKPEVRAFLSALKPFEQKGDFNPALLESLYRRIFRGIIETNLDVRPVFIAPELVESELMKGELSMPENTRLVPDLYFFRAVRGADSYQETRARDVSLSFPARENGYTGLIRDLVSRMLARRALYELQFRRREAAGKWIQVLKAINPKFPLSGPLKEFS